MNLRDQILAVRTYTPELAPVSVPQWPDTEGKLFVRAPLNAHDHERYQKIINRHETSDDQCTYAEVTALVLVDEHGARIFDKAADVKALAGNDIEPLQTVFNAHAEHDAAVKAKKKTATQPVTPSGSLPNTH